MKHKLRTSTRDHADGFWDYYYSIIVPEVHEKLDIVAAKAKVWWEENHRMETKHDADGCKALAGR